MFLLRAGIVLNADQAGEIINHVALGSRTFEAAM